MAFHLIASSAIINSSFLVIIKKYHYVHKNFNNLSNVLIVYI